ncbi:hypothetical protein [Paraburkholderia tagetis]|uniref:hypothetical protein n=1 Tax=Paraburkholderia tagetis TaxID=2913261 RepID=UPI001EE3C4B1|nr:hypothetical protein [Paraburkholderia tagetis]
MDPVSGRRYPQCFGEVEIAGLEESPSGLDMPLIVPRDELLQMPCWTMEIRGPQGFVAVFSSDKNIVDAASLAGSFKALLSRLIGAAQGNGFFLRGLAIGLLEKSISLRGKALKFPIRIKSWCRRMRAIAISAS